MPPINWLLLPTLTLGAALFAAGCSAARRAPGRQAAIGLLALAALGAVPGVLFAVYYLHVLDRVAAFYQFRALPGSELAAAGVGLLAGVVVGLIGPRWGRCVGCFVVPGAALLIFVPYAKPVLAPLSGPPGPERWRDEVCLQSTPATCGPACVATLLRPHHQPASERELARECFTYAGGTENWYLARALRRRGFVVTYRLTPPQPAAPPCPAIAGVGVPGQRGGHFVAILARTDEGYVIGDPLIGRMVLPPAELPRRYPLSGFFMEVRRP